MEQGACGLKVPNSRSGTPHLHIIYVSDCQCIILQGACGLETNSVQTVLTMDQVLAQQGTGGSPDNRTSFKAALSTMLRDFKVNSDPIPGLERLSPRKKLT